MRRDDLIRIRLDIVWKTVVEDLPPHVAALDAVLSAGKE
jgi:uncharacterized protein with HEPN domain